jgi:hypothetical protein
VSNVQGKIGILETEAGRAAAERQAAERQGLIDRIQARFADRAKLAADLQDTIARADNLLREILKLDAEIAAAWLFPGS